MTDEVQNQTEQQATATTPATVTETAAPAPATEAPAAPAETVAVTTDPDAARKTRNAGLLAAAFVAAGLGLLVAGGQMGIGQNSRLNLDTPSAPQTQTTPAPALR
jgi:hypothetical protein